MKTLGTSDEDIMYRLGIYSLNTQAPEPKRNAKKRYDLPRSGRAGVLKFAHDKLVPLINESEELIPRSDWKLDELFGETELQLLHPDYYKATNLVFGDMKRKHDILCVFQCSAKKPYSSNQFIRMNFYNPYKDRADFACISNPGIVPFEYSAHYPFRYDEWSIPNEKRLKEILNMTHKYRIVNLCRFLRYVCEMGYKRVIVTIPNKMKDWIFQTAISNNVEGAADWCRLVLTDKWRQDVAEEYGPRFKQPGMIETRSYAIRATRDQFVRYLQWAEGGPSPADSNQVNTSFQSPGYRVLDEVTYSDVIKHFSEHISGFGSESNPKEPLYRKYYWTALDLVLLGLDGNLTKDIDKDYHKIKYDLDRTPAFEKIGEFIYVYKSLCERDGVSIDDCRKEALSLKIYKEESGIRLRLGNPIDAQ